MERSFRLRDECEQSAKAKEGFCVCVCVLDIKVCVCVSSVLMFAVRSFHLASAMIHQVARPLSGPKTTQLCSEDRERACVSSVCVCVCVSVRVRMLQKRTSHGPVPTPQRCN